MLQVVRDGQHTLQLHHDEQLAVVLRMPFTSGHEISSVCCTQLPTVSPMAEHKGLPLIPQPPGPRPPPPPPPLPHPPSSAHSNPVATRAVTDGTSDDDRSSAPIDAEDDTPPADPARHTHAMHQAHHVDNPSMSRATPEASQACDHGSEQYNDLHNTGRSQSGCAAQAHHTHVCDGDCVQSFWPQSLSQDGTMLVCREYLWIPSTLYRANEKSPAAATAVHLLSVMHPHLHAFPGSSQMRYGVVPRFWRLVPSAAVTLHAQLNVLRCVCSGATARSSCLRHL